MELRIKESQRFGGKYTVKQRGEGVVYQANGSIVALGKRFVLKNKNGKKISTIKQTLNPFRSAERVSVTMANGDQFVLKDEFRISFHRHFVIPKTNLSVSYDGGMDGSYRIYRFEKEIGRVHRDRVYKTFGDSKNLNTMIVTVDDLSEKDLIVALAIGMDYIADIH